MRQSCTKASAAVHRPLNDSICVECDTSKGGEPCRHEKPGRDLKRVTRGYMKRRLWNVWIGGKDFEANVSVITKCVLLIKRGESYTYG